MSFLVSLEFLGAGGHNVICRRSIVPGSSAPSQSTPQHKGSNEEDGDYTLEESSCAKVLGCVLDATVEQQEQSLQRNYLQKNCSGQQLAFVVILSPSYH